ncbi:MAG: DUF1700 domain-containing protein [Ruminococcus sp.]
MNKQQFLASLREQLTGLPQEDIEQSLDYYREMIEDQIEDGLSEEAAVEALGSVCEIASQILMDTSLPKLVKAKVKPDSHLKVWEIILLVLGAPIWLPLLLTVVVIIMTCYIVLWSVILVLYSVDISFAAGAIGGMAGFFLMLYTGHSGQAFLFLGVGLICAGLAVLLFFGFNQITKGIVFISKRIVLGIKSCFIGKGRTNHEAS